MRARGSTVPLLCSLAIVAGAPAALAAASSLYSGPAPRPGPDVLYGAPAVAPQLENVGVWSAAPILVSGASAYRGGEFLYQDFLYDDHGAAEAPDPTDPKGGGNLFSKPDGTYTYPTDPAYANDAADVVELRVKPLSDATAFRLTLNTMKDASLVAFSIAIGGTPGVLRSFPAGANVQAPADLFLTVHPAGAGAAVSPAAFFNVAFRYDEPMPAPGDPAGTATGPAWWRDKHQGEALAAGDLSAFHADVDFAKLAAAVNDDMPGQPGGVPQTGPIDRILVSHFETAQGADFSVNCFPASTSGGSNCPGQYQGVLQPYAIYVPSAPMPRLGYGMTLLLHSLSTNYNQYLGSRNQSQFGDRDGGSIVITPESRGPDGFYDSYAGADVFEVWADVARRYRLDPAWSAITGYSMGGLGTFKLAEQFPDLFAKAQPTVGFSGDDNLVASLRNIPFLMWNSLVDELVPPTDYLPTAEKLDSLGYRYELDVFTPGDHLTLAINDQFAPAAAFLDLTKVNRNPAHVTFVADPTLDYPALGFVADHAYWLSGIELRSSTPPVTGGHAEGTIDALSYGFGTGDPIPSATQFGAGTLTGGNLPTPLAYTRQYRTWGPVPALPRLKRIDLTARNVAAVTINVQRASVGCSVDLHVDTDGPITIELAGCRRTVTAGGA